MGRQVIYEVHVKQKDRWEIHARHEDVGEAVEEAKTLDVLASVEEVKVVRDTYNPDTGNSIETNVYRSPKGQKIRSKARAANPPESAFSPAGRDYHDMDSGPELAFSATGKKAAAQGAKSQTFVSTVIKVLLIVLFSVTIAGVLAFGSIVFLRNSSLSNNAQTNIVFIIFIVTFLFCIYIMSVNFLKKVNLADTFQRPPKVRPRREKRTAKPVKKAAVTPPPKISPFEAGTPGAPPSLEALESDADRPEAIGAVAEADEAAEQKPEKQETPEPETVPEIETAPEDPPPAEEPSKLSPHAEQQRVTIMKFLGDSLEKMQADVAKLDSFNKFGINLYLAGAIEALGQKTMLDMRSSSIVLSETVAIVGFKKSEAMKFADKYEEYLLADARYMHIFQAGRNAMNVHLDEDPEADKYLEHALAEWNQPKPTRQSSGTVTVFFTDIAGSTAMTQELGDAVAQQIVRVHNRIVREALTDFSGNEIKHTGDGIMASFESSSDSVEAAIRIQQNIVTHNQYNPDLPLRLKIGINAGEPIAEDDDLFGSTVQMAARIVDKASKDEIFVSEIIRGICEGKDLSFKDRGPFEMKGFEKPPTLYEVVWETE